MLDGLRETLSGLFITFRYTRAKVLVFRVKNLRGNAINVEVEQSELFTEVKRKKNKNKTHRIVVKFRP